MRDFDIIVVGAGPAGLAFARALEGSGLNIALVERQPEEVLAAPTRSSHCAPRGFIMAVRRWHSASIQTAGRKTGLGASFRTT